MARSLTDLPDVYDALLGDARDPAREARVAARALAAHGIDPPACVLELCAGASPHGQRLGALGYRVVALDAARPMLARVRGPRPVQADVRRLPIADGAAAGVLLAFEALALFPRNPDLLAVVRECGRVLRPGGVALVDLERPGWAAGETPPAGPRVYLRQAGAEFIEHPVDWVRGTQRFEVRGRDRRHGAYREVSTLRLLDPETVALVAAATGRFEPAGTVVESRDPLRLFVVLRRS